MTTFEDLAASRREWIDSVLKPWCQRASLAELRKADQEWHDIAGRVDADSTLWTWAWSRFPALVHDKLSGVNETHEVQVTLTNGTTVIGFPDGRQSQNGQLVLFCSSAANELEERGPYSIDEVETVVSKPV